MHYLIIALLGAGIGYAIGWWQFDGPEKTQFGGKFASFESIQPEQHARQSAEDETQLAGTSLEDEQNPLDTIRSMDSISATDFASLALSPTLDKVESIIDGMSSGDLAIAINSLTGMGKDEISTLGDTHNFAKNLINIVFSNQLSKPQTGSQAIAFGTAADTNNLVQNPQTVFLSSTQRIYASFKLPTVGEHSRVLVKWFRVAPYNLQLMNRYQIDPDSVYNYVWFRPRDWEFGLYAVEVHTLDGKLNLLASGTFEIIS